MARTGRLGNACFKKEVTWGTYITGDIPARIVSESLTNKVDLIEDPSLVSSLIPTDQILAGFTVSGAIETMAHPDTVGVYLHGALGGESTIASSVIGYIILSYNGASPYARVTAATDTLVAELSADGASWGADTNFNTSGTIDLTAAAFDTLGELTTAIAAYTGWDAILCGSISGSSAAIADFTATNIKAAGVKVGEMLLVCEIAASTVSKKHSLTPAAITAELPSYSWTINRVLGTNKSLTYSGMKFNSIALSMDSGGLAKASLNFTGKIEAVNANDVSLSVPTYRAYPASKAKIILTDSTGAITEFDEIKNFSLTLNNNLDENKVIGSEYIKEPTRQSGTNEISFTANNIASQYAYRTQYLAGTTASMWLYLQSLDYADSTNTIPFSVLIRIPDIIFTDYSSPLSTGDRLQITAAASTLRPKNATYTSHIYAYVVDTDVSVY